MFAIVNCKFPHRLDKSEGPHLLLNYLFLLACHCSVFLQGLPLAPIVLSNYFEVDWLLLIKSLLKLWQNIIRNVIHMADSLHILWHNLLWPSLFSQQPSLISNELKGCWHDLKFLHCSWSNQSFQVLALAHTAGSIGTSAWSSKCHLYILWQWKKIHL